MKVSLVAQVDGKNSHALHLAQLVKRLPKFGIVPVVRPIKTFKGADVAVMDAVQAGPNDASIEIIVGQPRIAPTSGKKTIYLAAWESTILPRERVTVLNQCDLVIAPSNFCAQVFSSCGVTRPLHVVPLGFGEDFWLRPMPDASNTVDFLCVGNMGNGPSRKGIQKIIDHFIKAFPNGERVRLSVKLHPGQNVNDHGDKRIFVIPKFYDELAWAQRMAQCHCLIHYGVGAFELPVLESMQLGRPVIAPRWGGHADYFHDGIGLEVTHTLVTAEDSWIGHGHWARPIEQCAIDAMRWAYEHRKYLEQVGFEAHLSVRRLTWAAHVEKIAQAVTSLLHKVEAVEIKSEPILKVLPREKDPLDEVTVCITNFERQEFLDRAVRSVAMAGFPLVHVESMTKENDLGCNELWLRAAYRAKTKYVIILHDDDVLSPELGHVFRYEIYPALERGLAVTWRGAHQWNDGRVTATEYFSGDTRELPIAELEKFLLDRRRLSLSPIVTVFHRETLIHALKEADEFLTSPQSYLHPGMLLGTEVVAHLRQQQGRSGWLYINKVLSHYGVHDGSGTRAAEKDGNLKPLVEGYDFAREHFEKHRTTRFDYAPKILFMHSPFVAKGDEEKHRIAKARFTWDFHFGLGTMMDFPVKNECLPRTSKDIGDAREVPYLRDLFDYGCAHAMPEDVVLYCNADIALTANAALEIIQGVKDGGGACVVWRRSMPVPERRIVSTAKSGKIDAGVDIFAMTPKWWMEHRLELPDMFCCSVKWDWITRVFLQRLNKGGSYSISACAMHEPHESLFSKIGNTTPVHRHNLDLAIEFFRGYGDAGIVQMLLEEKK